MVTRRWNCYRGDAVILLYFKQTFPETDSKAVWKQQVESLLEANLQAIQGAIAEEGTELENLLFVNEQLVQANEAQKMKRSGLSTREAMTNQESTNPFSSMSQPMSETSAEEHVNLNSSSLLVAESAQVGSAHWDSFPLFLPLSIVVI